jgi:hypothetical protein
MMRRVMMSNPLPKYGVGTKWKGDVGDITCTIIKVLETTYVCQWNHLSSTSSYSHALVDNDPLLLIEGVPFLEVGKVYRIALKSFEFWNPNAKYFAKYVGEGNWSTACISSIGAKNYSLVNEWTMEHFDGVVGFSTQEGGTPGLVKKKPRCINPAPQKEEAVAE